MSNLVFPLSAIGAVVKSRDRLDSVQVDESANTKEVRSSLTSMPRYSYKIGNRVLRSGVSPRDFQQLASFHARHFGPLATFLLSDPEDSSVTDCGFAAGDGATTIFQLQRSLLGSVYDAYGLWPVSSKPRINMVTRSDAFDNAAWTKTGSSIRANIAIAPDSSAAADKLVESFLNEAHYVTSATFYMPAATAHTFSVFAKAGERSTFTLSIGGLGSVIFDVSAGTVGAVTGGATGAITAVGNGWYRCAATMTPGENVNGVTLQLGTAAYAGNGYSGLYLWGCQAEAATAATQYIATTSAAVTSNPAYWPSYTDGFEPVYDLNGPATIYQDGDWRHRRQLYLYARTNYLGFSEAFDNAAWTKSNVTVTANATAAPDGNTTAEQVNEGTNNTTHFLFDSATQIEAAGELHCYSLFLKANNLANVIFEVNGGGFEGMKFNIATGTVDGTQNGALASGVTYFGNGWYRIWFTKIATAGSLSNGAILQACSDGSYSGAAYVGTSRTFYVWGAMNEIVYDLSGPTPYISTPAGAAVAVTDYTIDTAGKVTLATAPPAASSLSWTGAYFKRCRFADPKISFDRIVKQLWSGDLTLLSVLPTT